MHKKRSIRMNQELTLFIICRELDTVIFIDEYS